MTNKKIKTKEKGTILIIPEMVHTLSYTRIKRLVVTDKKISYIMM